jgi:hypothetical protein
MTEDIKSQVRLYAILAREAPAAVVFRRGPSKQILLVLWQTDTDQVYEGQWLKGRVYERRCDLSPTGKRLIYFAANYKNPYFSWTALSQPPFLTALALWPKGDGWGGGGLFVKENEILLNHRSEEMELAEGFELPRRTSVKPFGSRPGWGEDSPIMDVRLNRDGWRRIQDGKAIEHSLRIPVCLSLIRAKSGPGRIPWQAPGMNYECTFTDCISAKGPGTSSSTLSSIKLTVQRWRWAEQTGRIGVGPAIYYLRKKVNYFDSDTLTI